MTTSGILLHGSGRQDIQEFEPRQSNDVEEFGIGGRLRGLGRAGIGRFYSPVMDRDGGVTSLINACVRMVGGDGGKHGPYYFF